MSIVEAVWQPDAPASALAPELEATTVEQPTATEEAIPEKTKTTDGEIKAEEAKALESE